MLQIIDRVIPVRPLVHVNIVTIIRFLMVQITDEATCICPLVHIMEIFRQLQYICTVLPAKCDSDVMLCLHNYQGFIIDRSLVYKSYPQDRIGLIRK